MDRQARINEAKQEIEAMFDGLDDGDAADLVKICQNAIETIEMRYAKKLRVFKEFYKPLSVSDTAENNSAENTQKIVNKYYQLYQTLPALKKLQDLDQKRKTTKNEFDFQVMIAERKEQLENSKNEIQIQDTNLSRAELGLLPSNPEFISWNTDADFTGSENAVNKK